MGGFKSRKKMSKGIYSLNTMKTSITNKKSVRLPANFIPERYGLVLHPDLQKFTFRGEETIEFNLTRPDKVIRLHADELEVDRAEIVLGGRKEKPVKVTYDKKSESVSFVFKNALPKGKGKLLLSFSGTLNDKMRGFYRSRYDIGGKEYHMATTQFESTDARRAFPCVDEPSAKAVFDVTLMIPKGHIAISNTIPIEIREHDAGVEVVKFEPTPKMSTYLLAFIVGKFEYVENKTKEGTLVRVFVTPGKKKQARFALDVASRVLSFYEKYFGIKYPLPVLDMIAVPDFSAGAMENWGAITYRETAILFDEKNSSTSNKQWVAIVIAHEIAHQWFGNLVTMEWWTHLWLNEGFASYIEYLAVGELFPNWDIWTQFVYQDLGSALTLDAMENTHPIEVEVRHPSEISEIFDAVSYQKGSSIIRMLAGYLGEDVFRDGLRHYLKKHQYANATTEDLWRAFEHVSGKPVRQIMKNWTAKPGYPLVRISETRRGLAISQRRFLSTPNKPEALRDNTIWQVPIKYQRESTKKVERFLLKDKSARFPVRLKPHEWVSLNAGAEGVYRVDYPARMLAELREAVEKKSLSARERLSILSDAFALAEAGELATPEAMALALSYRKETDFTVWSDLASSLGHLEMLLCDKKCFSAYRKFLFDIFSGISRRMGWRSKKGERHTDSMLRPLALYSMGLAGDRATIKKAQDLFSKMKTAARRLDPDIRGVVYGLVAENGGEGEFNWFTARHKAEKLHEEKNRLLRALYKFKDKKLIARALNYAFSQHVRLQDAPTAIINASANHEAKDAAWRFVKKNWGLILERYGKGGHSLPHFVKTASRFASRERAAEVEEFFRQNPAPGAERAVLQTIERIRANAEWLRRDYEKISQWLDKRLVEK